MTILHVTDRKFSHVTDIFNELKQMAAFEKHSWRYSFAPIRKIRF